MASRLPPPRRIFTANCPLPPVFRAIPTAEPAVYITSDNLVQHDELGGASVRATVFTHDRIPTNNDGIDKTPRELQDGGLVIPFGANIRFNDLAPGKRVPMVSSTPVKRLIANRSLFHVNPFFKHRTSTTDYNIVIFGEFILITPDKPAERGDSVRSTQETTCRPGDVILQRGTLHAWENRTNEWARSAVIMLGAEPTQTGIEGADDVKILLPDYFGN